ncbi:MAG TPA: TonB family protein [Gemmatimonadota bacterium]|nr:TonB family protein [Gemmatimonadota bacterium]
MPRSGGRRNPELLRLGIGLLASVCLHFAIFALSPSFPRTAFGAAGEPLRVVELPPDVSIPPPPPVVPRPARPRIVEAVSPDLTIPRNTLEAIPAARPLDQTIPERPTYIPYEVPPRLLNRAEIERILLVSYPLELRERAVGGSLLVWLYVDERGDVARALIRRSSGYPSMDAAALRAADAMRFAPALNRDRTVGVWVSQTLTLTAIP